jgi:hypothetical protein
MKKPRRERHEQPTGKLVSGLVEAETEARQRSAVSKRAVTRRDVMPSDETQNCQNRAGKQGSRESELRPHSIGRVTNAFAATALVVMGTLVVKARSS